MANKYHAQPTTRLIDGEPVRFDSRREAQRWDDLCWMQKAGKISDLRRQVRYELVPALVKPDGKKSRPVEYVADFVYWMDGKTVVEDAKGYRTREYQIKKKLMLWRHGIDVQEV